MTIELNQPELAMIEAALDAYEKEVANSAFSGAMLGIMLSSKEEREAEKNRFTSELRKADAESRERRVKTTLLRAKLYQAMNRESEHTVETAVERK